MKRIVNILRTLDGEEMEYLEKFLYSPIFNENERLCKLFLELKPLFPDFIGLKKELIFKAINLGDKPYSERTKQRICNSFLNLLDDFLVFIERQRDKNGEAQYLLKAYMRRGLTNNFQRKSKAEQKKIKKIEIHDLNFFHHQYIINASAYRFSIIHENRESNALLASTLDALDKYYLLEKMRYTVAALAWKYIVREVVDYHFLDEVLDFLAKDSVKDSPLIFLYHQLLLMYSELKEENYFFDLKNMLKTHLDVLPIYEIRQIIGFAVNYARMKVDQGKIEFRKEEFDYYVLLLKKKALFVGEHNVFTYISPHYFRNITLTAIELAKNKVIEFDWVENFIMEYRDKILPPYSKMVQHFCMAYFYFAQENFQNASKCLEKIRNIKNDDFIDSFYTIYFKTLILQTAYEQKEWGILDAEENSFRQYLRRNRKITIELKEAYKNFRKLIVRLFKKATTNPPRAKLLAFKKEIQQITPLRERQWLLEKIDKSIDENGQKPKLLIP